MFNTTLRKALTDAVGKGLLDHGENDQRFKLTEKGRELLHGKKKSAAPKARSRSKSKSKAKSKSPAPKKPTTASKKTGKKKRWCINSK